MLLLILSLFMIDDKKDKDPTPEKIVGIWELVKDDGDENAVGAKLELKKDKTVSVLVKVNGKTETLDGGDYKVENGKFIWNRGADPKKGPIDVVVIRKLTDDEMILKDEVRQRTMTFKRVK